MKACFAFEPDDRPSFDQIIKMLSEKSGNSNAAAAASAAQPGDESDA